MSSFTREPFRRFQCLPLEFFHIFKGSVILIFYSGSNRFLKKSLALGLGASSFEIKNKSLTLKIWLYEYYSLK